jgi:hypothetical protein
MTELPARSRTDRFRDRLHRLESDVDAWIATADPVKGTPYLVPLSFDWDGERMLISTPTASPTSRNLRATGRARVGLGPTRDVVLIDGDVHEIAPDEVTNTAADAFAARTGFDPRSLSTPYSWFQIRPHRIQAWREANELDGRDVMRDGTWLVAISDG